MGNASGKPLARGSIVLESRIVVAACSTTRFLAAARNDTRRRALQIGDVLVAVTAPEPVGRDAKRSTEDRVTNVAEREIPLRSLEGRSADAATRLYNLDVDGDDTYVANGLIIHNKLW